MRNVIAVLLTTVLLTGCGGGRLLVIEDRQVLCPKKAPEPTCDIESVPETLNDYDKFLNLCRSENIYWREARGGCDV